jgi:SAM-dependent methyltransferase
MSTQDRTLDHYQELMTINATSHLLRAARQLGVLEQLASGQKTLPELAASVQVPEHRMLMLIQSLISIGIVEQYQEDYALSSTARLLCQYDADLGDAIWTNLAEVLREPPTDDPQFAAVRLRERFDAITATQWVHTPAAMQAAEILDLGPSQILPELAAETLAPETSEPIELLDLGCGSAVWSCAMAFREPAIRITAIDSEAALVAATATATSIGLMDRFATQVGDVLGTSLATDTYDMLVVAQRLHAYAADQIKQILQSCFASLKSGGRLIVIDSFRGPHQPTLAESIESLRMQVQSTYGEIPDLETSQSRLEDAGFENVQFAYIAASRIGLGMMIGNKS